MKTGSERPFSDQFLMPGAPLVLSLVEGPRWMKTVARSQTGHSKGFVVFPIRCAFSGQLAALNLLPEAKWPYNGSVMTEQM